MQSPVPRVQVRPLIHMVVLALLLPVALAFLADLALGTSPLIAVVVSLVCIPLTTVLVVNRTLREMNAMIAVVAPPPEEATQIEPTVADEMGQTVGTQRGAAQENEPARQAHKPATQEIKHSK